MNNNFFTILLIALTVIISSCNEDSSNSNEKPSCEITNPKGNAQILTNDIVNINVDAEDSDGSIVDVRFYIDDEGVGSSNNFPYTYNWDTKNISKGDHIIKAKAFDDDGGTTSDEIIVSISNTSSFIDDRDGKTYNTIKIGTQEWMAENLNYDASNDNWYYEYNSDYGTKYGRLYTYEISCEVCPDGWHLPSDDEWKELEAELGMSIDQINDYGFRGTDEGGKLKGTSFWDAPNTGATNSSGFNALPAGARQNYNDFFFGIKNIAYFWTSSKPNYSPYIRSLSSESNKIKRDYEDNENAYSIRCVKD